MATIKEPAAVYQLKITLKDIKPPIWRRVLVTDCSLAKLHDIIQTCMGWDDAHLHAFDIAGQQFGEPDPDMETQDERGVKLSEIVEGGVKKFRYSYDFGDDWDHLIQVEKVLGAEPGLRYPQCVAGKRACPPEDCGGPWGYGNFLDAIGNPKHAEHNDMLEWVGGEFDPEKFDSDIVNRRLG